MKKWACIFLATVACIIMCSCQALLDEMNKINESTNNNSYNTSNNEKNEKKDTSKEDEIDYLVEEIIPVFDDEPISDDEKLDLSNYKVGEVITFGEYEQDGDEENGKEAIEWIILKKEDNYALLLSKYALDCMNAFWETEPSKDGGKSYWRDSRIRSKLNESFFSDAFDELEKNTILTAEITTYDKRIIVSPDKYNTVITTKDKVFIMSYTDMTNKEYGFDESWAKEDAARVCKATKYATSKNKFGNEAYVDNVNYWLRTQGETQRWSSNRKYKYTRYLSQMEYVMKTGEIHPNGDGLNTYYVRPACLVRIKQDL